MASATSAPQAPAAPASAAAAQVKAAPAAASTPHSFEVVRRAPSSRWAFNELLRDPDPHFKQLDFTPRQVLRDKELIELFGTNQPHSGDVVLHYAGDPPPGVTRHPVPVVLVHGASKNGNFWWDPKEDGSNQGLPQYLKSQGYEVYAVSFASSQDDNYVWEQQMANAIERVKQLTGAPQVDLVGHSKGGVPVRAYVSDFHQPWMEGYRGDVRRAVFVAAALGGIDYSFRHPVANLALLEPSDNPHLNAPVSWDSVVTPLGIKNTTDVSFEAKGADHWPGQRQLLAPWADTYPLPMNEPDWFTTYYGGQGFVSHSQGIEHYIHESGDFMPRLVSTPVDDKVDVAILAGNNPDIPFILNELTGPSDGLLFLKSATTMPASAKVIAEDVLPLNHKTLVSDPKAFAWFDKVLSADKAAPLSAEQRARVVDQGLAEGSTLLEQARAREQASS